MTYFKLAGPIAAIAVALGMAMTAAPPAFALVPESTASVNTDAAGLALRGYDAVAYFTTGKPTLGEARFAATFDGVRYHFASAENLRRFKERPAAYAPQFGGFCAMGVALDKKLDGDPNVWKIVDGKLYLNVNADVSVAWQRDLKGNIATAVEKWPDIKDKSPASLG